MRFTIYPKERRENKQKNIKKIRYLLRKRKRYVIIIMYIGKYFYFKNKLNFVFLYRNFPVRIKSFRKYFSIISKRDILSGCIFGIC